MNDLIKAVEEFETAKWFWLSLTMSLVWLNILAYTEAYNRAKKRKGEVIDFKTGKASG